MAVKKSVSIPRIGFGTYRMPGNDCQPVVESAIEVGYRHIDTAEMYDNEQAVGAAIGASGVVRSELFLTTKVWHANLAPDAIERAFDTSLKKLQTDYVDCYMVHWPSSGMNLGDVMETLMRLLEQGRTRSIGVCNFNMPLLKAAIEEIGAPINCLQIEFHPFLDQSKMLGYLQKKEISLVAHAPLAQGRAASDPILQKIGDKHNASAAQIAIAWLMDQPGVVAIPKAQKREHQMANLAALAIRLDDEDRRLISTLPKDLRYVQPPFAPKWDA